MSPETYNITENELSDIQQRIFHEVAQLYDQTEKEISKWLWLHHVQVVAHFALQLAKKYQGDADISFAAALLHDIADVWLERDDEKFEELSQSTTIAILQNAGYTAEKALEIFTQVIEPHSCYPGHLPQTLEGKILATADALAHLSTDFYTDFQQMGRPSSDREKFTQWVLEKLDRDFGVKQFFTEEKEEVRGRYEELRAYFSKGTK
jgi:hypothetical protein